MCYALPARRADPPWESRLVPLAGAVALAAILLAFAILQLYALSPHLNDDGLYFYGAHRIAGGAVPYRDFFHAHPPFHLLPTAIAFAVVGSSFALGKAVVFAFAAVQVFSVWLTTRVLVGQRHGPVVREASALVATLALVLSPGFLGGSSDDTGLVQSSGWLSLALAGAVLGRFALAGSAAGVAAMTSLQVVPLALVLGAALLALAGRRAAVRFALATMAILAATHLAGLALAGRAFLDGVYGFHLAKLRVAGEGALRLRELLSGNAPLFAGAGLSLLLMLVRGAGRPARLLGLSLGAAIAVHLLAMASRPRVFSWYFLPALVPAAVLVGVGLAAVAALLGGRRRTLVVVALSVLMPVLCCHVGGDRADPHEPGAFRRRTQPQPLWVDAPHLGRLNGPVRRMFWMESITGGGNTIGRHLRGQARWLDTHPAMVQAVRRLAAEPGRAELTLFGDYAAVPLVALEAGVRVTGDFVDTTGQRFSAGFGRFEQVRELLEAAPRAAVLLREGGSGVSALAALRAHLAEHYLETASFRSRGGTRHILYSRP